MDEMVKQTQIWLNKTYGNDSRYNKISEDGLTGWGTIHALIRALQIELGIQETSDAFGPTTQARYKTLSRDDSKTSNLFAILQGALWCKGYSTGHYKSLDNHFDEGVETALIKFKDDAGILLPHGDAPLHVMKALLSMDAFNLVKGGNKDIRSIQQYLNCMYENYFDGLIACNGIFEASTIEAFIFAFQAQEGMPVGTANGHFGSGTQKYSPSIPYHNNEKNYSGNTYSDNNIFLFVRLIQYALCCYGYMKYSTNYKEYNTETINAVKKFQSDYNIPTSGNVDLTTWMSLFTSCGNPNRSATACDCCTILTEPTISTLLSNGYKTVGRYLTGTANGTSKALSIEEIELIHSHGLSFFPIFQTKGNSAPYYTEEQGGNDAKEAYEAAVKLFLPCKAIIYFAVDFDATAAKIKTNVTNYFTGIHNFFSQKHNYEYKVGIYAARNVCTSIAALGYSCSSFVSDMSTGYSGNLGYPIPKDWAFDQFATCKIGSGSGSIEIDKDGFSGRYSGVSIEDIPIGPSLNCNCILKVNTTNESIIVTNDDESKGYIKPNTFFCLDPTNLYTMHDVVYNPGNGSLRKGTINIADSIDINELFTDYVDNNWNGTALVPADTISNNTNYKIFTVKHPVNYFDKKGYCLGTLSVETKVATNCNTGGKDRPFQKYFEKILKNGTWKNFNLFVDLGMRTTTSIPQRSIW